MRGRPYVISCVGWGRPNKEAGGGGVTRDRLDSYHELLACQARLGLSEKGRIEKERMVLTRTLAAEVQFQSTLIVVSDEKKDQSSVLYFENLGQEHEPSILIRSHSSFSSRLDAFNGGVPSRMGSSLPSHSPTLTV